MSGGSWDYLCHNVEDAAGRLKRESCPSRRAFGEHLETVAFALHEIEWVDSCDKSHPADVDAIRAVFKDDYSQREMAILIKDARDLIQKIQDLGA